MNPEFVLVVGDMFVPCRQSDIPQKFKTILLPNKMQHVLSLGNIGSNDNYNWLKGLSNDFHCVKGEFDEVNAPEKKVVEIGEFKIGMIHGHQILPWGDHEALANVQRELGCDFLLSGHTHIQEIRCREGKFYINPGSLSGAFSYVTPYPVPSFMLIILQGSDAIVYNYVMNNKKGNFEVSKMSFTKGVEGFKTNEDGEEREENENEEGKDNKDEVLQDNNNKEENTLS
jgi:vacuolar protein sorting-associated protein 29